MYLVNLDPLASWLFMGQAMQRLKQRFLSKAPKPPKSPDDLAREAAELRTMAYQYLKTDPGFAGDLFAAANRHELTASEAKPPVPRPS